MQLSFLQPPMTAFCGFTTWYSAIFSHPSLHPSIAPYLRSIPTHLHTYMTYLHTYMTYLHTYITYLHTYKSAHLHTYKSTQFVSPTHLHAYLLQYVVTVAHLYASVKLSANHHIIKRLLTNAQLLLPRLEPFRPSLPISCQYSISCFLFSVAAASLPSCSLFWYVCLMVCKHFVSLGSSPNCLLLEHSCHTQTVFHHVV